MKIRLLLRPDKTKITLMMIFTLLSLIIVTGLEWTTKMTWYANRGFPFPFLKIYDFVKGGSCTPYNICLATNIQDFSPFAMLMDLFVWYLVSCIIAFAYHRIKKKRTEEKSVI
jgi:glycopeptide antibiotics resistance protein